MLTIAKELIQGTGLRTVIFIAVVVAVLLPVTSVVGRDALVRVAGELSGKAGDLGAARMLVACIALPAIRVPITLPTSWDASPGDGTLELGAVTAG